MSLSAKGPRTLEEYRVHGLNDAGDDTRLATAITAMNARGRGVLVITGTLRLQAGTVHTITASGGIECRDGGMINSAHASSGIRVNSDVFSGATTGVIGAGDAILATTSKSEVFEFSSTPGVPVVAGEYVALYADNEIDGPYTRHSTSIETRPLEIHRIQKPVRGASDVYSTDAFRVSGFIWDALTTTPKCVRLTDMVENFFVKNVVWTTASSTPTSQIFRFNRVARLRIINLEHRSPASGQVGIYDCFDVVVEGCTFSEKEDPDDSALLAGFGYGLTIAASTGVEISGNVFGFQRHGITTGGIDVSGDRYGNIRDCRIHNNLFHCGQRFFDSGGLSSTAMPALDTHTEGTRIEVCHNTFVVGEETSPGATYVAMQSRSREAIIRGNQFTSARTANVAMRTLGPGSVVEGNIVENFWTGLEMRSAGTAGLPDDTCVKNNMFRDLAGPGVWHNAGDNLLVVDNTFLNNVIAGTDSRGNGPITINAGTGHRILRNNLTKENNANAIYLAGTATEASIAECRGNVMSGYDGGIGFDRTTNNGRILDARHRGENVLDIRSSLTVTSHSLTLPDNLYAPIKIDGAILDDTADSDFFGLLEAFDGNDLQVLRTGNQFLLSQLRLNGSFSYPGSNELYWDEDAVDGNGDTGAFVSSKPGDSHASLGPVLKVTDQISTTYLVVEMIDPMVSGGTGIGSIIEDTTPQLGGMLDVNGQSIGDGTLPLLTFVEDGSAVNNLEIENNSTGVAPILRATGSDADVSLSLVTKGTGSVLMPDATITGDLTISGEVDGRDIAVDGAIIDDAIVHADISEAEGFLQKTGSETYVAIKSNLAAAVDPVGTDDSAAGYAIGSRWLNTTLNSEWVALDVTPTAAVWIETTATAAGLNSVVEDLSPQLGGVLDTLGRQIRESKGTDIASTTTMLLNDDGNFFVVTGSNTIAGMTAKPIGTLVHLTFTGSPPLTSVTDFVIPGGDFTAGPGDFASFRMTTATEWTLVQFIRADGTPLGDIVHTGQVTGDSALILDPTAIGGQASASAAVDDYMLMTDTSNSGLLRKTLVSDVIALASTGATGYNNVKDYGAVGDNVNDDTLEIQAAIDDANKQAVFFPAGQYKISSTLDLPAWQSLLGSGRESTLRPTMTDGSPAIQFAASPSTTISVRDLSIVGVVPYENWIGIDTNSSTGFSIDNVQVINGGTGLNAINSWSSSIRNMTISSCDIGARIDEMNASFAEIKMQTCNQYFDITNSAGSQFVLRGESLPAASQTTTSKIDNCKGTSFDGMWFEYTNGTNPNRTIPFLTIGGTTVNTNISLQGMHMYGGNDLETGLLLDNVDGIVLSGFVNSSSEGNEVVYTANAKNVQDFTTGSAGQGSEKHRYGAPVALGQLPTYNFFRDPFFEEGIPLHMIPDDGGHRVNLNGVTLDTTTKLPGRTNSIKIEADASVTNARAIFEIPLEGELARLKGQACTVGAWIYAPSAYYDINTEPTVYPFGKLISDGTGVVATGNYNKSQHIPDNWTFVCWETADVSNNPIVLPADATFLKLDLWLQSVGSTPTTVAGQHIFVGGIVVAAGGQHIMETLKRGTFAELSQRRNNYVATTDPGVTNDESENYGVGSLWCNVTGDSAHICVDATEGAAVWNDVTSGAGAPEGTSVLSTGPETDGWVLTADGAGGAAWEVSASGATTPQDLNYTETLISSPGDTVDLDADTNMSFKVLMDQDVTTWTVSNLTDGQPLQAKVKGAFSITPSGWTWFNGDPGVLSATEITRIQWEKTETDGIQATWMNPSGSAAVDWELASQGTIHPTNIDLATGSLDGLMAQADFTKLGTLKDWTLASQGTIHATNYAGGNVSNTGTPVNDQIAVWTDATTVEGSSAFTLDTTGLNVTNRDLVFDEKADHSSTPGAGKGYLWVKDDVPSALMYTDDANNDVVLSNGGQPNVIKSGYTLGTAAPNLTVTGSTYMEIANTSPTTLTNVTGAIDGQQLEIRFMDTATALTTVANGTNFLLDGDNSFAPTAGVAASLLLSWSDADSYWTEISRAVNETAPTYLEAVDTATDVTFDETSTAQTTSSITWNFATDLEHYTTLSESITSVTISNLTTNGQVGRILIMGASTYTITWPTISWLNGAPELAAGKITEVILRKSGIDANLIGSWITEE